MNVTWNTSNRKLNLFQTGSKWRHRFEKQLQGRPALILAAIREIAAEQGKTPAQVALAWVLARPEVTVAILGCDDTSQLD